MQYISLLELNSQIRQTLDTALAPYYWVVAEISELRVVQKGHCYLELVEKENNYLQAKLRATIWAYDYRNISGWFESITGEALKPGMKVLAKLRVEFHELYGLSANIKEIDPQFTLGERARKKQEVIAKLVAEGVFDMNKQLSLPYAPQKIAVISSATAAGYGDFMHHLQHNEYGYHFHVKLYGALMQGCDAPSSIIKALYVIHDNLESEAYDLVAIIRGGGAQVDMDCFDDYELASHIAQFPLPVITGIGHERDESIADLVAHTKLKTPTAVSAFLISGVASFEQRIDQLAQRIENNVRYICNAQSYKLEELSRTFQLIKTRFWDKQQAVLDQIQYKLLMHGRWIIQGQKKDLSSILKKLRNMSMSTLEKERHKLDYVHKAMQLSDPKQILKKGYTISYIDGKLLKDAEIGPGKILVTHSENTIIKSEIIDNNGKEDV